MLSSLSSAGCAPCNPWAIFVLTSRMCYCGHLPARSGQTLLLLYLFLHAPVPSTFTARLVSLYLPPPRQVHHQYWRTPAACFTFITGFDPSLWPRSSKALERPPWVGVLRLQCRQWGVRSRRKVKCVFLPQPTHQPPATSPVFNVVIYCHDAYHHCHSPLFTSLFNNLTHKYYCSISSQTFQFQNSNTNRLKIKSVASIFGSNGSMGATTR